MSNQIIALSTMHPVVVPVVQIGQLVRYLGDMANPSGIGAVTALTGNEYGRYTVSLTDGRQISYTNLDDERRWEISDKFADSDAIAVLLAGVEAKSATDAAAKTSASQEFDRIKAEIKANNPHLITEGCRGYIQASKNIRIELKRAFPGVKFSVTSKSYSGGNHIDVRWTDGPTTKQVEAIADKYSGGSFDGMTDCYNYSKSPWTEVFGESKYIFCNRDFSEKMLASVIRRVCNQLGGMPYIPTPEDYNKGRTHSLMTSGGCDFNRELNIALSKHTYTLTAA